MQAGIAEDPSLHMHALHIPAHHVIPGILLNMMELLGFRDLRKSLDSRILGSMDPYP